MNILDNLFSTEGTVTRKEYFIFFIIFSVIFLFFIIMETALGGLLYLSVVDKLLGNFHFLFFPIFLIFLFLLGIFSIFFITYIAYSYRRACEFSDKPVQYIIYYTVLVFLIGGISMLGGVVNILEAFFVSYILLFIPYLFFKEKNVQNEQKK